MSNGKIQEYLRHIGSIVAIIGGVLAAMQSVETVYEVLGALAFTSFSKLSAIEVLPIVFLAAMALLAGGLSVVLAWFAFLAFELSDRKYAWRIIFCASIPFALGLVVLIITGSMLGSDSDTELDLVITNTFIRTAMGGLGNIFEYSALSVVGGVLILLSASKKLQRVIERQRAESSGQ